MVNYNPKEWVVVLGSGYSINNLPESLISWINQTKARIAINKFGYFFDLTKVKPNKLYFHDCNDETAEFFLRQSIEKTSKLDDISYYLSSEIEQYVCHEKLKYLSKITRFRSIHFLVSILRKLYKPFFKNSFNRIREDIELKNSFKPIFIKKKNKTKFIRIESLFSENNIWGNSFNDSLYHFRGSLTTVFNVISIDYPKTNILMLGVDLNDNRYFFDRELDDLKKKHKVGEDWTTNYMKNSGKHFSAVEMKGVSIFDAINYCVSNLASTGNILYAFPSENASIFKSGIKEFKIKSQK
ncbi:hypothetical protein [Olleya aquimaris]|uniref:DUF115 domain-containing protein n=1 Tax=Olleya aquimaris TaxID=639310 RepID=A0A327RIS1_9FLAO|nr:hypothetical protein [Olleya aquimaris]RAJ16976.1 hypothetical protein LY08_00754 [Olleya aquimaris]